MKKYYVNQVELCAPIDGCTSDWTHGYVGLFTNNQWDGRGSFCGYYGAEYYLNTTLLAFFQNSDYGGSRYDSKNKLSEVHRCREHFDKIMIGSGMWEEVLFAENDEEAIRKFENLEFEKDR